MNSLNSVNRNEWLESKYNIYKNLIIIGLAWVLLFTAFQSMANLQSSLNQDANLGTKSLSTIYFTLVFSCPVISWGSDLVNTGNEVIVVSPFSLRKEKGAFIESLARD